MEYWDVMDGGEYTDRGYTPTPYTPWEKEVMEWTTIPVLTDTAQVSLADGEYYKILPEDASSNEYVILYNSQSSGWQRGVSKLGHGMLVFRVDYSTSNGTPRTSVNLGDYPNNTAGKPGITLIPADSLLMNYYRVYSSTSPQSVDSHIASVNTSSVMPATRTLAHRTSSVSTRCSSIAP